MTARTHQSTFDEVAGFLLVQDRPSLLPVGHPLRLGDTTMCAYRGADNCKCAAGCLIPDDQYTPDMEGRSVSDDQPAGIVLLALGYDLGIVQSLQAIHDELASSWSRDRLVNMLLRFAELWELDPHVVSGASP